MLVVAVVLALILALVVTLPLAIVRRVGGPKLELITVLSLIVSVAVLLHWFNNYSEHQDNDGIIEFLIIWPTLVISVGLIIGSRFLGKR